LKFSVLTEKQQGKNKDKEDINILKKRKSELRKNRGKEMFPY
jgi:hypothetical protein